MTRLNPWVAVPSIVAALLGGALGWIVTDVSCRVEVDGLVRTCPGWSAGMAILGFLVGLIGVGTLMVLVHRSMAEANAAEKPGIDPPGPGYEGPDLDSD